MLNRINGINYKILLYRRPSKLNISNSKEHIDRLYDNKLLDREGNTHYYRKNIININIGLCGKNIIVKNHVHYLRYMMKPNIIK